jgi:predicted enzyme related to lactoylglutathione lyase
LECGGSTPLLSSSLKRKKRETKESGVEPPHSLGEDFMERVVGIGGVFFKCRDPRALAEWYREHLGVPVEPGQTYGPFTSTAGGEATVWSVFPADTKYFGPGPSPVMVNYRVKDLDAMLTQLRAAGAQVEDRVEDYDYGRFGWASDPEGNRFELWQPRAS